MLLLDDVQVQRGGLVVSRYRAERVRRDLPSDAGDLREMMHGQDMVQRVVAEIRRERLAMYRNAVPGNAYVVNTGGSAVGLTAATAKTIAYLLSGSNNQPAMTEACISFDGVTASAIPALVELCLGTAATNSTPGTGSTTFTPLQLRGWPAQTSAHTAANACSSEPTVLTSLKQFLITPYGGVLFVQAAMGREPTGLVTASTMGKMMAWRCNAPATVNVRGYYEFEE
jgi:hypothetical protein